MNIKNSLVRIFTKAHCHNTMLSDRWKLHSKSINFINNSNYQYNNNNIICNLLGTNNYDSRIITNYTFKVKNGYRMKHIPNLINKYKIMKLWWQHDSDFNLESYKKGTKQAMSVVTKCLHNNENTDPYITWPANKEIEQKSRKWNDSVKFIIAFEPYQIQQTIILNVNEIKFTDGLFYEIDTLGIGYKQHELYHNFVVEIFITARFERNYSKLVKPEWNITWFDITRLRNIPVN